MAFAISLAFLAAGATVRLPGCRAAGDSEARQRAQDLLNVAAYVSYVALGACVLGIVFARGLRRRFVGGLLVWLLLFAAVLYELLAVTVECALD